MGEPRGEPGHHLNRLDRSRPPGRWWPLAAPARRAPIERGSRRARRPAEAAAPPPSFRPGRPRCLLEHGPHHRIEQLDGNLEQTEPVAQDVEGMPPSGVDQEIQLGSPGDRRRCEQVDGGVQPGPLLPPGRASRIGGSGPEQPPPRYERPPMSSRHAARWAARLRTRRPPRAAARRPATPGGGTDPGRASRTPSPCRRCWSGPGRTPCHGSGRRSVCWRNHQEPPSDRLANRPPSKMIRTDCIESASSGRLSGR
jgi:hypothetical protein